MTDKRNSRSGHNLPKILGWVVVLPLLLLGWEVWARRLGQPWILPTLGSVVGILIHPFQDHFQQGNLAGSLLASLARVSIGFAVAAVSGVSLGILMGSSKVLRGLIEPLVELLRPLCPIAWIPFAIAVFKLKTLPQLFGIRYSNTIFDQVQLGMIFVLFWGAFFPILINTIDGVSGVRRNYLHLAKTLGANRRQIFLHVYLPAALPVILTGLRQGIGLCWFVIIAAEMFPGADSGIGYLLMYASDQSAMDLVLASMVIIATVGATLNWLMLFSTRRFVRWHGREL